MEASVARTEEESQAMLSDLKTIEAGLKKLSQLQEE